MLVHQVGPRVNREPGTVHDVAEAEAVRMLRAGQAELVAPSRVETATRAPARRAVARGSADGAVARGGR